MDKYYTPEKEELTVGFDCQYLSYRYDDPSWIDYVIKEYDFKFDIFKNHELGLIRCKYLDKDDIKTFGFEEIEDDHFIHPKTIRGLTTGDDSKIHLMYSKDDEDIIPRITLWRKENRGREIEILEGYFKNKKEFKKILQQTNLFNKLT